MVLLVTRINSVGFCSSKGLDKLAVVTTCQGAQYVEALGSGAVHRGMRLGKTWSNVTRGLRVSLGTAIALL